MNITHYPASATCEICQQAKQRRAPAKTTSKGPEAGMHQKHDKFGQQIQKIFILGTELQLAVYGWAIQYLQIMNHLRQ